MVAATAAAGVAALIAVTMPAQRQVPISVVAARPQMGEQPDGARVRYPALLVVRSTETLAHFGLAVEPDVGERLAMVNFATTRVFLIIDHRRPHLGHELKPLRAFVQRSRTISWLRLHVASCFTYPGAYLHMEHTPYAILAIERRHLPRGRLRVSVSYPEGAFPPRRSPACRRR